MNTEGNWLKSFVPNWNEVNLTENSAEKVYEIALINPENIFVASTAVNVKNIDKFKEKSLLKLIVIENKKSHKFSAAIMEFAAFEANNLSLSQLRYKNYRTFSGAVNFYKINGPLANGWIYKEGKLMAKTENALNLGLTNINTGVVGKGKLMLADAGSLACGTRSVAHWRKLCVTIGEVEGWGYSGSGTTTSCRWEVYHTTEAIYCQALESVEDAFGGFEGGGSIGEGYVDCAGVPNGTAYQTDCGCIGGTTGIEKCPSRDIRNKTTDPCISKTVNEALTANKSVEGIIADIIKQFDATKNVTINIYDGYIYHRDKIGVSTGIPKAGEVSNQKQYPDGKFSADVTLGIEYHSGTSKETIISTLIHEVVHAYLKYSGDNTLSSTAQHNIISQKYITPMAAYLKTSFGISLKDAYALAWSGVSDSNVYNSKTNPDTEYVMSDGNAITAGEIGLISGAYSLSTNDPNNIGYTKGTQICK